MNVLKENIVKLHQDIYTVNGFHINIGNKSKNKKDKWNCIQLRKLLSSRENKVEKVFDNYTSNYKLIFKNKRNSEI